MRTWTRAVEATSTGSLLALVGVIVLDPTAGLRRAPDWSGWVTGQQRLDRVMSRVGPVLFIGGGLSSAAAAVAALATHRPRTAAARAAATGCIAASIAVTLRVNDPVNQRLRTWRSSDEPPADWRQARATWDRGHLARRALLAAAALLGGWHVHR